MHVANSRTHLSIDKLLDTAYPSNAQLSPDGRTVVFEFGKFNKPDKDTPFQTALYLADVETGSVAILPGTDSGTNDSACWSPDGTRLAFLSNREMVEKQLYVTAFHGEPKALTNMRGDLSAPSWRPDGTGIAVLYDGTLDPQPRVQPDPIVYEQNVPFKRVWLVGFEAGEPRPLTLESYYIHEYTWSPDGARLVVLASTHPNPYEGWYSAQVYTVDLDSGVMSQLCDVRQQVGRLTWSPDGRRIAFVMGTCSDEGNVSGEVYVVPANGGEPRNLTPGLDHSVTWIYWRNEGIVYGGRGIETTVHGWIDPDSGAIRPISSGQYGVNGAGPQMLSVAVMNDTFAAVRESFEDPPNVYVGSLETGEWRPLHHMIHISDPLPPLRVENKYWTHPDGTPVHGFLVYPDNYEPGKRYPLFLHVHGGPSWSYVPRFGSTWERLMSSLGCLVLMPNPRGSWGRGEAFQSANVGDLGGGDWQDIEAGVDALIAEGLVDPDRMAIGGWSYGGYLVAWAITQTDRFRCAIVGASITNYESNYGVVKNREWQSTMFGSNVLDDVDRHRSRSPMVYARNVKTPSLIVHGMEDIYAPPQQAMEFYVALRYFGVPAELVLYPREPHGFEERAHQQDLYMRIVGWVERSLFNE